jgi:thiol:disulfide interchange protein
VKKNLILLFISLLFFNQSFAQKKISIDESELKETVKNIDNLIKRDSLNTLIIQELKSKLENKTVTTIDTTAAVNIVSTSETVNGTNNEESLGVYILTAIGLGLLALLMPCVFPIIPMTVTYFLKHSKSKRDGIFKALLYGLSIIIIYTSLAVIPALFLGEDFAIELSSNWFVNSLFFIVFILFGLSFLGMFEITLPASFVNKTDALSEKGGFLGIFFMAFTLVLVSFSCTVPFVSGVIISLSGGSILKPIIGMLAYSTTFAIPFILFAIFPTWLKSLPKSGSWMTVLKVILGFVEIGFAFKFLSAIDLSYGLDFFSRDLFISIWIVLAFVLGLYLLGKIILPHDEEVKRLGVPRLMAAIVAFTFGVYLIPGLFGAPLNFLSAILPPADYHTFNVKEIIREEVKTINHSNSTASLALPEVPLYGDILKLPHGINGYFDYDQAMRVASKLGKPVFIDFTGKNCGNCRKMENTVWSDPAVLSILKNDYLVVALYADTKSIDLPETENYIDRNGNKVTKLNKKNLDIEFKLGDVAQPYYVLLNPYTGEKIVQKSIGYEPNVKSFVQYLEEGKKNFKSYQK